MEEVCQMEISQEAKTDSFCKEAADVWHMDEGCRTYTRTMEQDPFCTWTRQVYKMLGSSLG